LNLDEREVERMVRDQAAAARRSNGTGANLGFEEKLWAAADKMRGHMDPAEYKHVALGLIFLKYISDAFQDRYDELQTAPYVDPEDRDEYTAENIFWVPREARWSVLQANAKQPTIGKLLDDAMEAIERENPSLKGVLPKDYALLACWRGLSLCPTRASADARAADRQLGLAGAHARAVALSGLFRMDRHRRSRRLPQRSHRHRVPGTA
jgi:hypothetical protein